MKYLISWRVIGKRVWIYSRSKIGGRNIAKDYLEKKLLKGEEKDDIEHL